MALPGIPSYTPPSENLPEARANWELHPTRAALLVHDMQRYFCRPFPQEGAPLDTVVRNIARLISAARGADIPVFYTAQKGNQFGPDRGLQADLWGPGMQAIPEHEEILPELAPHHRDIVLVKHRYSAFQRSNLESLMRARGRDQLIVTGIYAHIGCLCTAAEAFQRDIQPFAIADAQADFDEARHNMAMGWVASCCGGVLSTQTALNRMEATCN
ncbi:isochorismatase family protein [Paracoccus seriniphilus]|uniref:Bifunctional isochorismate lyase / aryl carrier protein n=1 Tax=Paracoccus seriniphilus TaxID=184748 RepID=A0A239Q1D6_9RHOB|nr:isochorismatase family protein [Paracoccus seriniphilus]WCR15874.1 isochorismatase family protein [Paracoccus seriniphilus]SNT76295.1 bifunctional isochorismate lyase / aryl carrier protein [Paracoccus seriniphilus]